MTHRIAPTLILLTLACDAGGPNGDGGGASLPAGAIELREVGFATPESVLHDSVADVYLVSNINGGGRDRDDNGFISRVSPDGQVIELKWIDGADADVSLSAPKGSAVIGDSLFVADIDSIRVFDRNTGAPIRAFTVENATALNDLAVAPDGALWVSDMGDGTPETAARTGLHLVMPGGVSELIGRGAQIEGPNGVAPFEGGVAVAAYRGNVIRFASNKGLGGELASLDASRLDGLVALPDGSLLVSSWDASAVFRVAGDSTSVAFEDLRTPADIGYDARRNRLLVPSFEGGTLLILPLE